MLIRRNAASRGFCIARSFALALTMAMLAAITPYPASAQEQTVAIDIAAGPLSTGLQRLAAQTGLQIGYDSALLEGLSTAGLSGSYTPEQALQRLLAGKALSYSFTDPRTVTLSAVAAGQQSQGVTTLPPIEVTAGSGGVIQSKGYTGVSSATGAKTDTPFVETPQSISSVTEAQLEDRNPKNLTDAIAYTPGARVDAYGTDPRFDSFFVRGFNVTNTGVFRDNLRQPVAGYGYFVTEPYGIEGISILRGPSSALYGATGAGGLYNVITKRPTEDPLHQIQLQFGSNDRYQGQFDLSGPLNADKSVLYRVTGLGRVADTEFDSVPDDKAFIAPAMTWTPNDDTKLTLLAEYARSMTGGNPAYYNDRYGHVTHVEAGDPAFGDLTHDQGRIGWEFEHHINDTFTLRQNARYAIQDIRAEYVYTFNGVQHAIDPNLVDRGTGLDDQRLNAITVDNQLETKVETGPFDHTLLTGVDFTWVDFRYLSGGGVAPALNLADPNYGEHIDTPELTARTDQTQTQTGVYVQDQIRFDDALTLTLGGRHDWVTTDTKNTDLTTSDSDRIKQTDRKFSGRVGLTYTTPIGITPYASLSTAFSPNVGINNTTDQPFKPTTSVQQEVGIKYLSADERIMVTAAVFNVDQNNGLFYEVINGVNTQVQRGKLRSRGAEFEATASLGNGLSFTGSYTYTELKIREGTPGTVGNYVSGVPKHMAAAWIHYALPEETAFAGFAVGFGARYIGTNFGDDINTLKNNDRVLFDASASYDLSTLTPKLDGVAFQINATNLADRRDQTCTSGYCYLDPGRSIIGSLKFDW
jgi:iron complex outermembrane receptor protein